MSTQFGCVDTAIASAGTGKTTRLVELIANAIQNGIAPERILGTTFTVKAADELLERARCYLVASGRIDEATRLLSARMGTVNSVCGRLVSEFSLDLGRSPSTEVIPEEAQEPIFSVAADEVIAKFANRMLRLGERFGLDETKTEWTDYVRSIISLARSNGVQAESFKKSAEASVLGLRAAMPPLRVGESAASLDQALQGALERAATALSGVDLKKTSQKAASEVMSALAMVRRGRALPWPMWARLAKSATAKADEGYFSEVVAAASAHPRHPRLIQDIEEFTVNVFDCAAEALEAYQSYKAERGLLDFVDQETLALSILTRPDTLGRVKERLGVVFVDEVQDSSPLQIAIYTALAAIAPRSVWVGDPKQSIYAFRGTDSKLTLAASRSVAQLTGGSTQVLAKSWRSRPGIIDFINDAFIPAFSEIGLPENDCRIVACECDDTGFDNAPLSVWKVEGSTKSDRAKALAQGIKAALTSSCEWMVRNENGLRELRAGDVAILCRSGQEVARVASELGARGVRVAVERDGLFACPEVEIVVAALKWTADPTNRLALAEIARLLGGTAQSDAWLNALFADTPEAALKALVPFATNLEAIRERQLQLTPGEILDEIIVECRLVEWSCRWGTAVDRLSNLEALRGAARRYEESCRRLRAPATLAGLALWLEEQDGKRPESPEPDAVQVMTYHGAKGLEWPLVILTQLEDEPRCNLFTPCAELNGEVDWRNPLDGRWIRCWPWPYGAQQTGVHLDVSTANCVTGRNALKQAREEAIRLLYVGATRARDYLVFLQPAGAALSWVDQLTPPGAASHVIVPSSEKDGGIRVGPTEHSCRFQILSTSDDESVQTEDAVYLGLDHPPRNLRPLSLRPSLINGQDDLRYQVAERFELGDRIPLTGAPEMDQVGEAIHSVLAADRPELGREVREARALAALQRWSIDGIDPRDVVTCADRLWAFLHEVFPTGRIRRELPVHARRGTQVVNGRIDLLVEGTDWFIVLDHKSFPGRADKWDEKALGYAPQLNLYASAVAQATGKACRGQFIHMPIVGTVCRLECPELPV